MKDMIVVLPGIMGSVLEKNGQALWDPQPGMAKKLFGIQQWLADLAVTGVDDPANPGFIDGVVPVGLARSTTVIPGKVGIDGYNELHTTLHATFGTKLIEGDPLHWVENGGRLNPQCRVDGKDPARHGVPNYYRFAYDWRRDLRASALRLSKLIDDALPALVKQRSPKAKVIFLTHSMGGLLARYYVEGINPETTMPFDGWKHVRALHTIGTPHRGSLDALSHLVNGYKKLFIDFTPALLTMTGCYQLLPRYRTVHDQRADHGVGWKYPHELVGLADFDATRAAGAFHDFHRVIQAGVERNRANPGYNRYYCQPLLGFGHTTDNSAQLDDHDLELRVDLPPGVDPTFAGGDGTVPLVSALPIDYSSADGEDLSVVRELNQKHSALHKDERFLEREIKVRLLRSQASNADAEAPDTPGGIGEGPSIDISHALCWLAGERGASELASGRNAAQAVIVLKRADAQPIKVTIENSGESSFVRDLTVESGAVVELDLPAGEYRISASANGVASTSQFAVLEP